MIEHTKGPWRTGSGDCHTIGADWPDGRTGMRKIALTCSTEDSIDYKEQLANTKLIAAAPDLLDVCESLAERIIECRDCEGTGLDRHDPESACRNCGGVGEVLISTGEIGTLRDAIAKARGKKT